MSEIKTLEMPKWGLSMEEGLLARWAIQEGDSFTPGQEICEIETSKIVNVLEAPFAGTLRRILAREGETLQVGAVLALAADASVSDADLDEFAATLATAKSAAPGTEAAAQAGAKPPSVVSPPSNSPEPPVGQTDIPVSLQGVTDVTQVNATPHALRLSARWGVDLKKVRGSGRGDRISVSDLESAILAAGGRLASPTPPVRRSKAPRSHADDSQVPATPLARRLAGKLGINLHDCRSSGSRGRVSRDDVLAAALLLDEHPQTSPVQESTPVPYESIPMSGMRRAIASRLQTSKQQSPHFRLSVDLDLERLLALRQEINREVPGVKISVNDLLVKACALALVAVPDVNIQFDEATQSIRRFADADISVAVALPAGLITPIVRSANRKSISDISNEIHSLVTRAKAGTLKPEEFQGGTFSVSNLGMLGVRQFDAIINPPQSAILAIGAGELRAVVRDGQIVARQQMTVSLSCDHRVIDGAAGAAFLRELKRLIETPTLMFIQETSYAR
ncbi:2-oxo acid dehydrogenase subunit E2 [Klebsiella quasipneumoniae subsp. similipneumoniae]|uniref:Dihydrolipoamide acetyltransferase component of pyruvate dehydrogenase complex n=1 Tax=Klebsiella quasipneumoniae subsp. similipneumoniae TaxID=1463164 RepID=A0AAE4MVD6_9ENTR|nr:2-oxo acid dehydrogenase subunit E2 [Klebsiella quasipneumoniae]MDV0614024.1 2-oxo acid dehydrogenase subunit E2 [Klebsiella quasipneumoniae subsp. similipneumoniae]MDV0641786.1 2-oxo acid dehydrogenase subunit E2 [Klebsiella quasipneumoniae subsp. similipneumoniae]MDV0728845.1 2-oxo acid dehydrogenase subunit E2 [Klebsiella quasipneumoniae subsp. similipneumoniae]MDV0740273.1 2-oxo acid dehydrogenase subunit E2 [Klebsiella quasipneumoniae subsp. similipneumoniae]MDV0766279.1 2-oxo acid deh